MIVGFLFLARAKSGYTISRRSFLCNRLTIWQDAPSHRTLIRRYDFFKRYAQGLADQFAQSTIRGLYRPPSMICSGTGRPVHPIDNLGTIPTTEHDMLGDWSTSLPILTSLTFRKSEGCTNRRARRARGPVGCFHSVASKYDAPLAWKMQLHNV